MLLKFLSTMLLTIGVIAQILPNDLVALIVPVVVWLATTAVNWVKSKLGTGGFGGTVVVTLIVPALSLAVAWIAQQLLNPGLSYWMLVGLGVLGTFFNEFIKQWAQTFKGTQTSASPKLSGLKDDNA